MNNARESNGAKDKTKEARRRELDGEGLPVNEPPAQEDDDRDDGDNKKPRRPVRRDRWG